MVFIHGGGFVNGSGNEEAHGPKYLLRKDVIVVTFNYRLGILGFLSLDTEDIPGNAGMKDQVAALRWIKKNIKKFGGDPDNITLFGESAGAASVSFHLVSPMSKGLFNKAITQSGTITSWWPKTFRARDRALLLARDLGCNSTDDKEIYEFFKRQPAANLVDKKIPVSYSQSAKKAINVYYGIVSETQFGDRERFFYGDTYEVLRHGIHEEVAVISGYTQDDGILWFADNVVPDKLFDRANHFLEFFVPEPYTVNVPLKTQMEIGERFRNFYLQNKTASKATLDDLLKFFSMELFIYGSISQQKIIAKKNKNKTYLYKFTCYSELNFVTVFLGLQDLFDYRPVVAHADDMAYIFSNFKVNNMSQDIFKMIEQVTTLWTNFAKYGDPTPDDSLGVKWLPYTVENEDYLDIGETFLIDEMDTCYLISLLLSRLIQVQVNEGIIQGQVVSNPYGCPFFSFRGIPYAEPPVGDLRFKAPQPKTPWEGIRNATEHASHCFKYEMFTNETNLPTGSEDCLYLNVYSPNIAPSQPFPVMVFIHGGGFVSGSGNDNAYGPQYLVRKDVVLVTLNYRLEILGFLSLDTEDIPGNAGMKDQVAALRWIKNNIRKFGGDPDNITIFGESAGGASVSFHLVSPMSKGLFKRAITQSGTLTSWWPNTFRARDRALLLAKQLGCNSTDDKEIAEFFRAQPIENLVNKRIPVSYWQAGKETPNVYYGIVQEKEFSNTERFFYGHPFDVLRKGIHEGVEVMNGYTEDEGILYFSTGVNSDRIFEQANHFLEFFVPEPYTTDIPLQTQMEIGSRFKNFYMKNETASRKTLDDLLKYFNMELFVYGTISQEKIIAKNKKNKSYLYKFTCKSELNMFIVFTGLDQLFNYRPVVAHSDDLGYIFPIKNIDMNSTTFKMIEQVTTLWTNFAKYGDPTPDDSLGVKWLPYTIENEDYLDIGENLVPGTHPENEELEFWESNFGEFLPEYVP
ncbi:unnamed protein product [Euphydryas editha]|uniref:Carboxylesterase type B domain-containing protein n=1 Tax=Euphydryas editha TaxID=104508 RepID=A0AAU9TCU4_EUPED|nr:unnamed protein product [Euphydryas editha]